MATKSSREAALERRKALTDGGKKASGRYGSGGGRVRSAADARPTRTNAAPSSAPRPAAAEAVAPAAAPTRQLSAPSSAHRSSAGKRVSNPSRDLVLSRREAMTRGGKRADTSKDRTRTDVAKEAPKAAAAPAAEHKCKCQEKTSDTQQSRSATLSLSTERAAASSSRAGSERRAAARKGTAQHNASRALVLARREALSKRGKSASNSTKTGAPKGVLAADLGGGAATHAGIRTQVLVPRQVAA